MSAPSVEHSVVGFARALRGAGVAVGVDQSESFARALSLVDPTARRDVYLAARATLVSRREDLPLFDALFGVFWSDESATLSRPQKAPWAPRHDRTSQPRTAFAAYMAEKARADDPDVDVPELAKAASALELLQRKEFGQLTPDELRSIERTIRELRFDPARRVTRRRVPSPRGKALDLRRALRVAARYDGAILALPRRRRKEKRRPLVVLADISGSMEIYSRILLQFFHGLTRVHRLTETFVFATRLTCITSQLRMRQVDEALDHAARAVVDFAGGTRIADSLRTFHRLHARRVLRRGAVVLLVSDGWETGDLALLEDQMRKLQGACHRLVWLNPLLGRSTYRPLAEGMSLALRYVDDFLSIHNLQSLKDLSVHLGRLPSRKRARLPGPPRAEGQSNEARR
ncbi:MAG TPA: VWA domain-containing protein [Polyangiaceae bacterium]